MVLAAAEAGEAVAVAKLVSMGLATLTESLHMATCMWRAGAQLEAHRGVEGNGRGGKWDFGRTIIIALIS